MPETSLADLLGELETLDLAAQARRFHDIVAELANHRDELPGGLAALARSLAHQKRCAAALAARRGRREEDAGWVVALLGDAHPAARLHAARALYEWAIPAAF